MIDNARIVAACLVSIADVLAAPACLVSIADVLAAHGIQLRRIGDELVGPCPACRDGLDRFGANLKKNVFNCRKCNAAGDAIALEQLLIY